MSQDVITAKGTLDGTKMTNKQKVAHPLFSAT